MPPKKQQEEASGPYLVWNVLPIFCGAHTAIQSLRKSVNIKKTLELNKIIEILKEKGIDKYIQDGQLSEDGYHFACQNLQQAANDFITQLRKPADPKKDQKKDTKKDSKKEEAPPEETEKIIEFAFQKSINEFLVFLDFPKDIKSLKTSIENGWKIDVVVWIEEMIKESSRLPNYALLNKQRSIDDFLNEINSMSPKPQEQHNFKASKTEKNQKAEIISELKRLRTLKIGDLDQTIIIQIPYLRDLQHPEIDATEFLTSFFKKLCELTLNRTKFQNWKKQQQIIDMVPTIKEKIKKEVIVEEKKDEKKGGKKQANAQPQIQIVEEIIEKRYEDLPGNAKSNLQVFKNIARHRNKDRINTYDAILDNLALSISQQTQKSIQIQKTNILQFGASFLQQQKCNPSNKITIQSISNRTPKIIASLQSAYLRHGAKLTSSHAISNDVSLAALLKNSPFNKALEYQYKLELFDRTMKDLQTRLHYSFEDRVYAQKLDAQTLNSRINLELDHQPKIYQAESKNDQLKILILARVNPPGRIFYDNSIFDWKVLPNFEFWEKYFKDNKQSNNHRNYWNYDWRNNGNLKVLTKKLMPTDNLIITESLFVAGDSQYKVLNLQRDETLYELKSIRGENIFSKNNSDLHLDVFTQHSGDASKKSIALSIRRPQFTILFDENPTIFWSQHPFEQKRSFGISGEVIKYLKNGSINILYPNGNCSFYQFGEWKHIKNNKITEGVKQNDMKMVCRTDGDKKIAVREDETVFVDYPNGNKLVLFRDGTTFTHISSSNTIQISNQSGIVIRRIFPRSKDFNVIGTGSAFAFLGQTNILERSFDGGLFELHHSTFTWHSYTECVDRDSTTTNESVKIITFRDGSMMKINHAGLLTFLHENESDDQSILHERWLQLFTNPEYHGEGVYDVDIFKGTISTKDKESNIFKLSLSGDNDVRIAVSFNISNLEEETNHFGNGYHVPEENYFLPPPQNHVTPRLFLIYNDGSGEQFLTEEQVSKLKGFKKNRVSIDNQNFVQLIKQNSEPSDFYENRFTKAVSLVTFELPSVLRPQTKHLNLIPSHFNDIIFRNLEEIVWDKQYKKLREVTNEVQEQRRRYKQQLERLRKKV